MSENNVVKPVSNDFQLKSEGYTFSNPRLEGNIIHLDVEPKWISVKKRPPDCEKVLAIFVSQPNQIYNMRHDGWFRDTIYACWMKDEKFIIESHGPCLPATHWMPLPNPPKE